MISNFFKLKSSVLSFIGIDDDVSFNKSIFQSTPEWICSSETVGSASTAVQSPRRCGAATAPDTICAMLAGCTTK